MCEKDKIYFKVIERGTDRYWDGYTDMTYDEMLESLLDNHQLDAWGGNIDDEE